VALPGQPAHWPPRRPAMPAEGSCQPDWGPLNPAFSGTQLAKRHIDRVAKAPRAAGVSR